MNMKKRIIQSRMTAKAWMIALLLGVLGESYAYDFSAVCETGQTLYYSITDTTNHYVEMVAQTHLGIIMKVGTVILNRVAIWFWILLSHLRM